MSLNAYPEFFGALYLNDTDVDYQQGKSADPAIQLFDWNGTPLAEIRTDRKITVYDIDLINGVLYTLNHDTEEIFRYDIREILENLQ